MNMSQQSLKHLSHKLMRKYRIEYQSTEGWGLYDPKYTNMNRADCAKKLEELMEGGENPNYLRAVPDS